jgi:GntR family transcriptional repressor for pyruvate dehydrogenase complex
MSDGMIFPNLDFRNNPDLKLVMSAENKSLSLIIMNSIMENLIANRLKPGDRLPTEQELCRQFRMSRNTVREAIKMLSMLGLINIKRGDGTYIAEQISTMSINPLLLGLALEPRTNREIIELRQLLDIGVFEILIDKVDDSDFDCLEEINNEILKATDIENPDVDKLFKMDLSFHKMCYELNKNRLLTYLYQTIYEMFAPSIKESVIHDPGSIYRNHAKIIAALRSRNKQEMRSAVLETLTNWRNVME